MSSPESVTIRSRTPGEEAVAFTTEDGEVIPNPPSTVLKMVTAMKKGSGRSQRCIWLSRLFSSCYLQDLCLYSLCQHVVVVGDHLVLGREVAEQLHRLAIQYLYINTIQ